MQKNSWENVLKALINTLQLCCSLYAMILVDLICTYMSQICVTTLAKYLVYFTSYSSYSVYNVQDSYQRIRLFTVFSYYVLQKFIILYFISYRWVNEWIFIIICILRARRYGTHLMGENFYFMFFGLYIGREMYIFSFYAYFKLFVFWIPSLLFFRKWLYASVSLGLLQYIFR